MKKRILPILLITVAVAALIAYREMKASLSNRGDKYGFRSESPD